MTSAKRKKRTRIAWKPLLYGALTGTAALILLTLLLTLFLWLGWLPESAIPVSNTVIRIAAAFAAGVFIGLNQRGTRWYFGGIAAVLSLLIATAAMSVYLGSFRLTWNLAANLLMSFAVGSAASAVFFRRNKE